jgi:transcriptional regulator with XRE-family HTH domain
MTHETIKTLREFLGLSQDQFARLLGVHPMTVSKWERNVAFPPDYNIQQMEALREACSDLRTREMDAFHTLVQRGLYVQALGILVTKGIQNTLHGKGKTR